MSGGTWKKEDKKLPGAYINVVSQAQPIVNDTEKGVVFTLLQGMRWGENGVVEVDTRTDFRSIFGVGIEDASLDALRLILLNARKVYVFNFNGGEKATGNTEVTPWEFEAKYGGSRGNDIQINVSPDPSGASKYIVQTFFGTDLVDTQSIFKATELKSTNFWNAKLVDVAVEDEGAGMLAALTTPVLFPLSGGTDLEAGAQADALGEAIETYDFNVLTAAGQADTGGIHQLLATLAIRLRDEQGKKVQAVIPELENYKPDHEGVIVVANGVKLKNGTVLPATLAAAFVAGATSAAESNQSLTYTPFPDAVDAVPRFNEQTQIEKVDAGELAFISSRETVKILTDINSLHTFTDEKNQEFKKNRVLRVLDDIANNTRQTWEDNFIGKVTNDAAGQDLFKSNRAQYLNNLQNIGAITNFDPAADVIVGQGETKDSVTVTINVQPTDSMEKLYGLVIMG